MNDPRNSMEFTRSCMETYGNFMKTHATSMNFLEIPRIIQDIQGNSVEVAWKSMEVS